MTLRDLMLLARAPTTLDPAASSPRATETLLACSPLRRWRHNTGRTKAAARPPPRSHRLGAPFPAYGPEAVGHREEPLLGTVRVLHRSLPSVALPAPARRRGAGEIPRAD